eukprot:5623018-Pleurochrysis_carterae.AAC.1
MESACPFTRAATDGRECSHADAAAPSSERALRQLGSVKSVESRGAAKRQREWSSEATARVKQRSDCQSGAARRQREWSSEATARVKQRSDSENGAAGRLPERSSRATARAEQRCDSESGAAKRLRERSGV